MDLRPDLWDEIVESYDGKKDPIKGDDHGTYSQLSVVLLLVYLAFGKDYPYNIAKFPNKFSETWLKEIDRSSVLWHTGKIGTLLKMMAKDELLIATPKESGRGYYYEINPKIIQSPRRVSPYLKRDGSTFMIPPETIVGFLGWLAMERAETTDRRQKKQLDEQRRQKRHERADEILERLLLSEPVDYLRFLDFIKDEAEKWDLQKESNHQPVLVDLISDYIWEINKSLRDWESCAD